MVLTPTIEGKLARAEEVIKYTFKNKALLMQALTHRSVGDHNNQRMEWFGDSVLQLVVSEILYCRNTGADEAALTLARTSLVSGAALQQKAQELGLAECIITAKGVSDVFNENMLEDMLEAIIGAVWLDGGYTKAYALVDDLFSRQQWTDAIRTQMCPKNQLQVLCSQALLEPPCYKVDDNSCGRQLYHVTCFSPSLPTEVFTGTAPSIVKAEQIAAEAMIKGLNVVKVEPNAKSRLLELCHKLKLIAPEFTVTDADQGGFLCHCKLLAPPLVVTAVERSKKAAERRASHQMLKKLRLEVADRDPKGLALGSDDDLVSTTCSMTG